MGTSNVGNGDRRLDECYSKPISACCSSLPERIAKVAPTANRCMIENSVDEPVGFVHLIPPTGIPSAHFDYLEYSWKKKPGTLNLHTRYNSMLLGTKLRDLFNQEQWILLPEPHILALYLDGRCDPMSVPPATSMSYYRYTILPLSGMASVPIRHHALNDVGASTVQTHTYPYPNLGFITFHLHPHYVIFNSARTVMKSMVYREHYPGSDYEIFFDHIIICYGSWTVRIANLKMNGKFRPSHQSYDDSDSESDSPETNPPSTPRWREPTLLHSSVGQQKKVSIEEWRNVVEGDNEIRDIQVPDALEREDYSLCFDMM